MLKFDRRAAKTALPALSCLLYCTGCVLHRAEYGQADEQAIYRISEVNVAPEWLDTYLAFARQVAEESIRREPGVVSIFPMQDKKAPTKIRIIEIYDDTTAYRNHLDSPHFKHYKEGTRRMVKELKLIDHNALIPSLTPDVFRRARLSK